MPISVTRQYLHGFVPAAVTPCTPGGEIREDAFQQLVERLCGYGTSGGCVAGDDGERWTLGVDERRRRTRLAVSPDGLLAVAHAQAGRAWVFDALGDPLARIDTPGGLWTTAVAWSPAGDALFIVEAQSGSIHRVDRSALA